MRKLEIIALGRGEILDRVSPELLKLGYIIYQFWVIFNSKRTKILKFQEK